VTLRLRHGVVLQRLGAEAVLLDTAQGSYFELNPSGVVVLEHLLAGGSAGSAASELVERYEVDVQTAERDSVELLAALNRSGLLAVA
jgi:hypothetical protein